ncbi:MAG: hypothetical protein E7069_01115 [Bacteroidales bacterium]|nr:hypothetical protein [Bacteroidales bacterium]
MRNKLFILSVLCICMYVHTYAQMSIRDSLMQTGRNWREMGNNGAAINEFMKVGDDEGDYEIAATHYAMGQIALALSECKAIIKRDNLMVDEAYLLMAACREVQGFDRAAKHIYKKLVKNGNAMAAYKYAAFLSRGGHNTKAVALLQTAISRDRTIAEAHLLLATLLANQGERFKAMMPLYYYLLINNDEATQLTAYKQLTLLWKKSANVMQMLRMNHQADPFNDDVDKQIAQWAVSDSIGSDDAFVAVPLLAEQTKRLFSHLRSQGELNLDFWQVYYSDFFALIDERNYTEAYVHYISDTRFHSYCLLWINNHAREFDEFRLWMEAQ